MRKVIVIDTSVLCCYLSVPQKDTCGSEDNKWDCNKAKSFLEEAKKEKAILVLPLATIIETGNHIAHAQANRYNIANDLATLIEKAVAEESPWATFNEQNCLWSKESLKLLAKEWPKFASEGMSLADVTIKNVADYYSQMGNCVQILSGDEHLLSYQPISPKIQPRRRNSKISL